MKAPVLKESLVARCDAKPGMDREAVRPFSDAAKKNLHSSGALQAQRAHPSRALSDLFKLYLLIRFFNC